MNQQIYKIFVCELMIERDELQIGKAKRRLEHYRHSKLSRLFKFVEIKHDEELIDNYSDDIQYMLETIVDIKLKEK